ncbi:MAG: UvrD-helicase domain-containing protein [Oligoflexia bacterium]|nr:UvrD-helicase domain-containing protein [Oligoflexia bacterium]
MSGETAPATNLSPEQQQVVDTWGRGMAVLAGAGSGKTTTLVLKCAELLRRRPDARFAAVSFTERSAGDLRLKLSERLSLEGEGGALGGHWVMTIHGLCRAILREYPREAGFDGEETMLSEAEGQLLWERAIESLWFDELPPEVARGLDALLARESRASVFQLLKRVRELAGFGGLESLARSEDEAARALAAIAGHVLSRFERLKRRRGALDFSDLELGADRALEHAHVREAFHRRFELVLVDEFQDTNPLQARIILRFCRPDTSNLCVVGDPKQSIYRFRDADVSVFEDFCRRLPSRHVLSWNFRSRPGIIEFANAVCARAFAEPDAAQAMPYDALEPRREADPGAIPVGRLDVRSPAELAAWIGAEAARGVPLHEMALLVRRIRGNEKWFKALTAAGIPIAIGSGGLFWEDPRARELVAFLRWWDLPANSLSGAVFLRAPWVGVADAELDAWHGKDPTLWSPFFASSHPLARALSPLRERPVRPGELLEALLVDEGLERELGAALLGLWHRAEELSLRGLDFHQVVLELARAIEEGRRERDVPPPRNLGQLPVLTFHSSKGLEFKHVILIDLGEKPRAMPAPLLFWDRERGAYLGPRDGDGERDRKHPVENAWRETERARNLAESKRIFYVALTRARERLVLACPELSEKAREKGFDPAKVYGEEDWRGWLECSGIRLPALSSADWPGPGASTADSGAGGRPVTERSRALPLRRPRHSVTEWNLLAKCPRAYEWMHARPRRVPCESEPEQEGIPQADLGSRAHAALELGNEEALRALEAEFGAERFRAAPVLEWLRSSRWMRPGLRAWSELAFEVPVRGPLGPEALVGSIDRLALDPDSERFAVIDFKVTARARAPRSLLESYRLQLELYAWAIQALQPGLDREKLEAWIVNLSPEGVSEIRVPLEDVRGPSPEALASEAARIVAGGEGEARPGSHCRYCRVRVLCPRAESD